ncbi:hypothetical protein AKJ16_DCAP02952 [Drosera capensis]
MYQSHPAATVPIRSATTHQHPFQIWFRSVQPPPITICELSSSLKALCAPSYISPQTLNTEGEIGDQQLGIVLGKDIKAHRSDPGLVPEIDEFEDLLPEILPRISNGTTNLWGCSHNQQYSLLQSCFPSLTTPPDPGPTLSNGNCGNQRTLIRFVRGRKEGFRYFSEKKEKMVFLLWWRGLRYGGSVVVFLTPAMIVSAVAVGLVAVAPVAAAKEVVVPVAARQHEFDFGLFGCKRVDSSMVLEIKLIYVRMVSSKLGMFDIYAPT